MVNLKIVTDFSRTPGPRLKKEGEYSGEIFRREILKPKFLEALQANEKLIIDLDGVAGFGTSFLEESFGGLIRVEGIPYEQITKTITLIANEDPSYIDEIWGYINDAYAKEQSKG